jgi:hypothetical protein
LGSKGGYPTKLLFLEIDSISYHINNREAMKIEMR